ncbi:MAG: hypothetical protein CL424_17815 [Acidimicrobiaceae bacterium]|nr:hypothetical protein [Acidimicrobiaceae bacterium]
MSDGASFDRGAFHRICPRPRRAGRSDRGSSTVEFAIATALMVMVLLVIVQVGVYFHLRAVAHTAARHGLDEVRIVGGSPGAGIAAATDFLDQSGSSIEDRSVTADRTATTATVRITGDVVSVVPGLQLGIDVVVAGPVERLTP